MIDSVFMNFPYLSHEIEESFDMHIHDHRQDDPVYKEHMYKTFGEYLQMEEVEFWKLQTAFHWGLDRIAQDKDEQHFIEMNMQHENFYQRWWQSSLGLFNL